MIELKSLILCDAATVRDGLLHVLGGGISAIWRASYPDAFLASVAASFEVSSIPERGESHDFRLAAFKLDESAVPLFELEMQVTVQSDGTDDIQTLPLVFNLTNAGIESEGRYAIRAYLDGQPVSDIHFSARVAPDVPPIQPFA